MRSHLLRLPRIGESTEADDDDAVAARTARCRDGRITTKASEEPCCVPLFFAYSTLQVAIVPPAARSVVVCISRSKVLRRRRLSTGATAKVELLCTSSITAVWLAEE